MNHLLRCLRGTAALGLLLLLIAGTPWVLLRVGRVPQHLGPFPEVLIRPDDGALLLGLLTAVGWSAWAVFTVSVLLELAALLTGRRLGLRLPGLAAPRNLAAGLLLTVAAMLPISAHAQPAIAAPVGEPASPQQAQQQSTVEGPAPASTHSEKAVHYTVRRGDDLWSIAERFYGDGRAWTRIQAANPIIDRPGEIEIGWELVLPGLAHDVQETAEEPADPDIGYAPPAGEPAISVSSTPDTRPVEVPEAEDPVDRIAYATAGVSSLIAAALLGQLATRRTTQLNARECGRRLVPATSAAHHFEVALGQAQDPLSLATLDLALRALGRHYRDLGAELPALGAVLVEDERLVLEVDRVPDRLPGGFSADGRRLCVGPAEGRVLAARAGSLHAEPAPYPTLVCLGETPEGALLLQDLESFGAMGLAGPGEAVRGMLNSLVLELSSSWWGRGQSVLVIDGDTELIEALDDPAVESHPDLTTVLDRLEAESRQRIPLRAAGHPRDVRCQPDLTDSWRPRTVLIGRALTEPERRRVCTLTDTAGVVVVAADAELPGPRVQAAPELTRLPNGHAIRAQAMTPHSRDGLVGILRTTSSSDTTSAPWWSAEGAEVVGQRALPARGETEDPAPARSAGAPQGWASDGATILSLAARRAVDTSQEPAVDAHEPVLHSTQPTVLLAGPVELIGARGAPPARAVRQCVEYTAWLLENPGATASMMAAALFVAEGTRRSNMSRLRAWLGADDAGERYLPEAYSGRIRLHPEVTSDWNRMQLLTIGGVDRASEANLAGVLQLVRGAPLADAAPGQWHWAEELRTDIASLVRDTGLVLCDRALERGDLDRARWAVNRALAAAPEDERLMVARVRVEHRAGNQSEVERLALRIARAARKLNTDLAEETVEYLQQAIEGQPRARILG